jgi:hypothetical protein
MKGKYNNPWIPTEARRLLAAHTGTILDVGGGAAPYAKASHILDIQPFSAERLQNNAWPVAQQPLPWKSSNYTSLDITTSRQWPFDTGQFDLGISSHCLEDLRDPIPAVCEMTRVCRRILIIFPSRLIEQIRGIEHPLFCGFYHHPWIVFSAENRLIFRRKTPLLELPKAHLNCPIGKTLRVDDGSAFYFGESVHPEEQAFWSDVEDLQDYSEFIEPFRKRKDLFVDDGRRHDLRFWIWRLKQRYFGCL